MIVTEFYKGQGLGNQLACYVTTKTIALDKGYKFGIKNPQNFKGLDFLDLDFGEKVIGGQSPEGGPATKLPDGIKHYYVERKITHPLNGSDIRLYDPNLVNVLDNTKIDGVMQGEQYIEHRKDEIREWLKVKTEYECFDYSDENTCVINFRGGEYTRHPDFFLTQKYWDDAIVSMRKINPSFRFIVITDDTLTAKRFFPDFGVFHFSIGKDYSIIKNAHYLILSNSTFAWFPAWLSENLKYCIAPKYFARHNISDGYWSLGTNITKGFMYQDKEGKLFTYEECISEFEEYKKRNKEIYENTTNTQKIQQSKGSFLKRNTPLWIKNIIKSIINEYKFILNKILQPIDLIKEKNRQKNWLSKQAIQEYKKNIKIYDCFNFFNELELLEIRLNILDPYVDYFVILEATETFTGKPKKLFYQENKEIFKKWEHKIIHHIIRDTPQNESDLKQRLQNIPLSNIEREIVNNTLTNDNVPDKNETQWLREFYQKEYLKKVLIDLADEDFCYVSDLDEIWNPEIKIDYSKNDIFRYKQIPYIYYLNNRSNEDWTGWAGTIGTKYKNIKNNCLGDLRTKTKNKGIILKNGGWHFSFQGGAEIISSKIESYSHQEINTEKIKINLEETIKNNKDIRGRFIRFWKDEKDLPKYLLENKEKYKKLLKQ
jgi:hypothetical protein